MREHACVFPRTHNSLEVTKIGKKMITREENLH